jgi:hypothetical protein
MWGIETFVTAASQPSPPEDKPLLAAY